jgi:multiple sugar transport system ATP-binding protein
VMATTPGYSDLKVGDPVSIGVDMSEAVFFSSQTGERLSA